MGGQSDPVVVICRNKMRVLVITTFYGPDLGPGAPLYTMLCEDLARLGHQVSVIAAVPHYPTGRVAAAYRGRLIQRDSHSGVDITRVWVPSLNRARLAHRLLTFVVYQILSTLAGLRRDYDVVLAGNPALEVFLPFAVLAVLRGKPAIFSVHDLYPEVGIRLGIFRHNSVVSSIKWMEDFCLKRAKCVRVLSDGFRDAIRGRGVEDSRIMLVWDWLDPTFIRPLPRVNSISTTWDLDNRFVVLYAGNIGLSQGLECVLRAAAVLSTEPRIRIVFVGEGAGKKTLQEQAAQSGLSNVHFFPFQPRADLPLVLATSDVSLICLKRGVSSDSVPSKFYSILASARPMVAAVDPGSDTWRMVLAANCGVCVAPEEPKAMAEAILDLYRNPGRCASFGKSGREYVVTNHSRASAARRFHEAILTLASTSESHKNLVPDPHF